MERIQNELYYSFLEKMPIVCIDLLLYSQGNYLLVKRKNEPARDKFWFPGGRLFKNEKIEDAALRIAKTEVGLFDCSIRRFLGVYETIFDTGPNNIPVHSVNLCYFLVSSGMNVKLDKDHSEFKWINQSRIPIDLDSNLKNFIESVFLDQV